MSPALAIARNDLLVRDKGALFGACVFPLAFGLVPSPRGRFWRRQRAHTERRKA
jgi:hypothetical protein